MLLHVLERRWLEDIDTGSSQFTYAGGERGESSFLRIRQVRYGPDRQLSLHPSNMLNVLGSLKDSQHTLIYGLHNHFDGHNNQLALRMGLRKFKPNRFSTEECTELLRRSLHSNFPGIEIDPRSESYSDVHSEWLQSVAYGRFRACITGIPSLKGDAASFFIQSVDRLVDALRDNSYALLILAEPIDDITDIQDKTRALSEEVHALVGRTFSESQNRGEVSGQSVTTSTSISAGLGGVLHALVGFQLARSQAEGRTTQTSEATGLSLSYEWLNKTAQYCETLLEAFQARLQRGRNLGLWNVGVFLATDDDYTFLRVQGILRGLYTGQGSYVEPLRVLDLSEAPSEVGRALVHLRLPRLVYDNKPHPLSNQFHGLGTPLATDELAVMMSLPHREVPGLKLSPTADFNLNPPPNNGFELGTLVYRGEELKTPVRIAAGELTRHAFVTGLTGSGKTNSCLALLAEAYRHQGLPFMVIDPAKTEYRSLQDDPDLSERLLVFTLGDENTGPFRLNPFEFERGFSLLGHVDLVKAVFNAAFPMYASMPYILEEAILAVYQDRGWKMADSTNKFIDLSDPAADPGPYWPRLRDLYAKVDAIVNSKRYGAQLTQDISAALRARLGSLLHGNKGSMLNTTRSTPFDELLKRPVVLELRGLPDADEKAFIMALIFIRLYEACWNRGLNNRLHHMTLIEEAHRLLRNVPTLVAAESANPRGKTVEMFADMMAEMRVYGEGFVVVDQMPSKLIPDVIKGSNLKIVHRLLALEDRAAVGAAMNLSLGQMEELTRLRQGRAVVHSEGLEEACLVQMAKSHMVKAEQNALLTASEDDPAARDKQAGDRIRKQMAHFYTDYPEVYWDARLEPDEALIRMADRFVTALLVGRGIQLTSAWRAVDEALAHHAPGDWAGDQSRRARVLLAAHAADRLARRHPHSADWGQRVSLQESLAAFWERRPDEVSCPAAAVVRAELLALRHLARQMAARPRQPRPGCACCSARCHYGHRLQPVNNHSLAAVVDRFKGVSVERPPEWALLRRLATEQFPLKLTHKAQGVAAYCLLTQISDDERLLADGRHVWLGQGEQTGEARDE